MTVGIYSLFAKTGTYALTAGTESAKSSSFHIGNGENVYFVFHGTVGSTASTTAHTVKVYAGLEATDATYDTVSYGTMLTIAAGKTGHMRQTGTPMTAPAPGVYKASLTNGSGSYKIHAHHIYAVVFRDRAV